MTVFELGRMSHLDLLALWHLANPDGHRGQDAGRTVMAARMTKEQLAAALAPASPG